MKNNSSLSRRTRSQFFQLK